MNFSKSFDPSFLIKNSPNPLSIVDRELKYLSVSKSWQEHYLVEEYEAIGRNIFDLFPNIDPEWKHLLKECLEGRIIIKEDISVVRNNRYKMQRKIIPWRNEQNEIGGLVIILDEIYYSSKIEEQLRISNDRFRNAFEYSSIGMAIISPDGQLIQVNKKLCSILGYNEEELLNCSIKDITHPDHIRLQLKKIKDLLACRVNYFNIEKRCLHKNGQVIWVYLAVSVVKDVKNNPIHFVCQIIDRTAAKLIESEVIKSREELEKATEKLKVLNQRLEKRAEELVISNQYLEEYAFVASHDLQEPLRMISSFLELLNKKYHELFDDKAKKYISCSIDGAHRMQKMIQGLLEYSTIGKSKKHFEKVDLNLIFNQAIEFNKNTITKKEAVVQSLKLPVIIAVKSMMLQLFHNLINNGLKYQNTGVTPILNISYTENATFWLFTFADNGIGIERKYVSKIFSLFQRLHEKNEYSGSGIGLATCKKIVESHRGKIWVESKPGEGSCFHFSISKNVK
ncbi:MAG: hypothetical protein NVS3B19_18940 [Ginsengibacter sp.]